MGHWSIAPTTGVGMRGAPGVPALGHVGLDPRRCSACLGGRAPAPPPPPPRPPRAQRVVAPRAPEHAPRPIVHVLDEVLPGVVDELDGECDVRRAGGRRGEGTYLERAQKRAPRPAPRPISARMRILLTVWTYTRSSRVPMSFGWIVMGVFEQSPSQFALPGFPAYPDSNRVQKHLSGREGLVARGLIERVAPRMYRVTPRGRRRAAKIAREAT